jgi:HTH-type transcriptional regulator/antitoxin HipB
MLVRVVACVGSLPRFILVETHERAVILREAFMSPLDDANAHERALSLPEMVVARRKTLGLRQEDLADLAGVSHRFVQSLEAGKRSVQLDKVEAVLDALGLRLEILPARRRS